MTWLGRKMGTAKQKQPMRPGTSTTSWIAAGRCGSPFEPTMRVLEPRFMFDAAGAATVVSAQNQAAAAAPPPAAAADHGHTDPAPAPAATPAPAPAPASAPAPAAADAPPAAADAPPASPVRFTAAAGPAAGTAAGYTAQASGYDMTLTGNGVDLTVHNGAGTTDLAMHWVGGADHVTPTAADRASDPDAAKIPVAAGLPGYGEVRYANIYSGIDLVVYGNAQHALEYDVTVAPGADAGKIALQFTGAQSMQIDGTGNLIIGVAGGEVTEHTPQAYQIVNGQRVAVDVAFELKGDNTIGFSLGYYDTSRELYIDPTLTVSTPSSTVTGTVDSPIALPIDAALRASEPPGATLSVTIDGLPGDVSLRNASGALSIDYSGGGGTGSITLTEAQLDGLAVTPGVGDLNDFVLHITATANGGGGATANQDIYVSVLPAAPELSLGDINGTLTGTADAPIALPITAALTSGELSSGTLSLTIDNLPSDAVLRYSNNDGTGTVTTIANSSSVDLSALSAAQLASLTVTLSTADESGFTPITITATTFDNGESNSVTREISALQLTPLAPALTLARADVSGPANTAIPLNIGVTLGGAAGTAGEVASVLIEGLPTDATLTNANGDPLSAASGSITLTPDQLVGLALTATSVDPATITLHITATNPDNIDSTAEQTLTVRIGTNPLTVGDASTGPALTAGDVSGLAGSPIPLNIGEADPGSIGTITLSGLPAGATLTNAAGDVLTVDASGNSQVLSQAQLAGLAVTPPAGTANFSLHIEATDGMTTVSRDIAVAVGSHPFTATDAITGTTVTAPDVAGQLTDAIPLNIGAALTGDAQLAGDTLSITLSGFQAGDTLNYPGASAPITSDGSTPIDLSSLTPAQLAGLTLTPAGEVGSFSVHIDVSTLDSGSNVLGTVSRAFTVNIGQTDAGTGTMLAAADVSGLSGAAIPLAISETDTTGGVTITLSNIPADIVALTCSQGDLYGSIDFLSSGNGTGTISLIPSQLAGLTITPTAADVLAGGPGNRSFSLHVEATDNSTYTLVQDFQVSAAPTALTVADVSGTAGAAIPLNIVTSSEAGASVEVSSVGGLPVGATLGYPSNADGTGTLTTLPPDPTTNSVDLRGLGLSTAQVAGLVVITTPADPAHFTLTVTATTTDSNGYQPTVSRDFDVTTHPAAPALSVASAAVGGAADTPIPLNIGAALTADQLAAGDTLSVTITNIPADATLINANGDALVVSSGSITLTTDPVDQLVGLAIRPTVSDQSALALQPLTVTATTTDANGHSSSVSQDIAVTVYPAAPTLTVAGVYDGGTGLPTLSGPADAPIALPIVAALTPAEQAAGAILTITISGVPADATLTYPGAPAVITSDGSTPIDLSGLTATELAGLTITPAASSFDEPGFRVTVTVTTTDPNLAVTPPGSDHTNAVSQDIQINVSPAVPVLSVADVSATADSPTPLNISAALTGTELAALNAGQATLQLTIENIPGDASLSYATGDGTVTTLTPDASGMLVLNIVAPGTGSAPTDLTATQLASLAVTPGAVEPSFSLHVTATVQDDGGTNAVSRDLTVTVTPAPPSLSVSDVSGHADSAIPLGIVSAMTADEAAAGASLTVTITHIPADAILTDGNGNVVPLDSPGTISFPFADQSPSSDILAGLTITPGAGDSRGFTLTVTATVTNGASNTLSHDMTVSITPVAVVNDGAPTVPAAAPVAAATETAPLTPVSVAAPAPAASAPASTPASTLAPAPAESLYIPPPPPQDLFAAHRSEGDRGPASVFGQPAPLGMPPGLLFNTGFGSPLPQPSSPPNAAPLAALDRLAGEGSGGEQALLSASLAVRSGDVAAVAGALRTLVGSGSLTVGGASEIFSRMSGAAVIEAIRDSGLTGRTAVAAMLSRIASGERVPLAQFQRLLVAQGANRASAAAYLAAFQKLNSAPRPAAGERPATPARAAAPGRR